MPEHHYLNNGHGLKSWLLTKDHKRIAIMYLISISVMFFLGGLFAVGIRLELATPQGDFVTRRHLQQVLHDARRDHGVLLPDPVDSGGARQLPDPADDRREGPGVPAHQPAQSLHLLDRRHLHALRAWSRGGVDTGWTFYTPYSSVGLEHQRHPDRARRLHRRLLVDPDRPQLHRHHSPHARAGHDAGSACRCSCGRTTPPA